LQFRNAFQKSRLGLVDQLRLLCIGMVVGFWSWRAADQWSDGSSNSTL